MNESVPQLKGIDASQSYDRETTREDAIAHLEESLSRIEVPENVPAKLDDLYRREHFLVSLDKVDFVNSDRHMARIAEEEIAEIRLELSGGLIKQYQDEFAPRAQAVKPKSIDYSQT